LTHYADMSVLDSVQETKFFNEIDDFSPTPMYF
jgi:hypothetical protein